MKTVSIEYLQMMLDYDPDTGVFTWKVSPSIKLPVGSVAGSKNGDGRNQIMVNGKSYSARRLAWLFTYGGWPEGKVGHINGVKDDDRIAFLCNYTPDNLQERERPAKNNTSGARGVSWHKGTNKWVAHCRVNGKTQNLGSFTEFEQAAQVVRKYRESLFQKRSDKK
ncbi:TPA: AP2 domain-containing protein [Raoultella planticola]